MERKERRPYHFPNHNEEFVLRLNRYRKGAYVRASKPMKLNDWILNVLDEAANYKELNGN